MEQIEDKKQFAVLIDSDNISARYASIIFNEIENYGYASFRRIVQPGRHGVLYRIWNMGEKESFF